MSSRNGGGGGSDTGLFAFALLFLAGPFIVWFILHKPMVFLWSWISYAEMDILVHVAPFWTRQSEAGSMAANAPALHWLLWAHAHPGAVTFTQLRAVSHELGLYFRWPIGALLLFLGWRNYLAVELRKDRVSLNQFVVAMKDDFPWGLPWLWQEAGTLLKSRDSAFAYALRPWEFVGKLARAPKGEPDLVMISDQEAVRRKFVDQLGAISRPYKDLPAWLQALSSALVPQARDQNNKETFRRLAALARIYYSVKPATGKPYMPPAIEKTPWEVTAGDIDYLDGIAKKHAFQRTAFLALLKQSRSTGMVPPSYMAWLRAVDRTLWYAVQSVDRPRAFVEGAGVAAHYAAETAAGGPLEHACVDDSLVGLVFALREEDGTPPSPDGAA